MRGGWVAGFAVVYGRMRVGGFIIIIRGCVRTDGSVLLFLERVRCDHQHPRQVPGVALSQSFCCRCRPRV